MPKPRWTIIQPEWKYRVVSTMILPAVIAGLRNRIFATYRSSRSASRCCVGTGPIHWPKFHEKISSPMRNRTSAHFVTRVNQRAFLNASPRPDSYRFMTRQRRKNARKSYALYSSSLNPPCRYGMIAHLNAIDLARDRTRNLGHRRPALYHLANQVDGGDDVIEIPKPNQLIIRSGYRTELSRVDGIDSEMAFGEIGRRIRRSLADIRLRIEENLGKFNLCLMPVHDVKYVFPNSSHSCHYRRYRTYRNFPTESLNTTGRQHSFRIKKPRVRIGQFLSDAFQIHCGLKQSDALSPELVTSYRPRYSGCEQPGNGHTKWATCTTDGSLGVHHIHVKNPYCMQQGHIGSMEDV
ncbi:hypothetical protein ANN_15316 [Periplaneta americana]|uniref:Uncharacterized protein n=1 Tax=Periplaneta americana TaxID=6978 RepID=A0ABQ8SG30_PERAM|nr:hypothetical protein ANN_15316 [Periplaneta americana]